MVHRLQEFMEPLRRLPTGLVERITKNGQTLLHEVNSDLVGAPSLQSTGHNAGPMGLNLALLSRRKPLFHLPVGHRVLATFLDTRVPKSVSWVAPELASNAAR